MKLAGKLGAAPCSTRVPLGSAKRTLQREYRRFSHAWKSHRRDRTGWLPWKDSNRSASISNRSTRIIQSNRHCQPDYTRRELGGVTKGVSVMAPRERTAGNENPKLEYCGPNQRSDTRSVAAPSVAEGFDKRVAGCCAGTASGHQHRRSRQNDASMSDADLVSRVSPVHTATRRSTIEFNRWSGRGIWQSIYEAVAGSPEPPEHVALDSPHVKARRCAGGGKGGPSTERDASCG